MSSLYPQADKKSSPNIKSFVETFSIITNSGFILTDPCVWGNITSIEITNIGFKVFPHPLNQPLVLIIWSTERYNEPPEFPTRRTCIQQTRVGCCKGKSVCPVFWHLWYRVYNGRQVVWSSPEDYWLHWQFERSNPRRRINYWKQLNVALKEALLTSKRTYQSSLCSSLW